MAEIKGGKKFEAALAKIAAELKKPGTLRVGFLEGGTYPDGTSIPMVAAVNNYGGSGPPRPFFSNMVAKNQKGWPNLVAILLKKNKYDVQATLLEVGDVISQELQQSIRDTNSPPLAESTIEAKGFDKPLIHHAIMINSVGREVK